MFEKLVVFCFAFVVAAHQEEKNYVFANTTQTPEAFKLLHRIYNYSLHEFMKQKRYFISFGHHAKKVSKHTRTKRDLFGSSRCHFHVIQDGESGFGQFKCQPGQRCTESEQPCPTWSNWYGQELCNATCGQGFRIERRYCKHKRPNWNCDGGDIRYSKCNLQACPTWSDWSPFTSCTKTCGIGQQVLARYCLLNSTRTTGCDGPHQKVVSCTGLAPEELCNGTNATSYEPSECTTSSCLSHWENWSSWSHCSSSCGSGYSFSTRDCIERQNTSSCVGESRKYQQCFAKPCWSDWSSTAPCSASCGSGMQRWTRKCQGTTIMFTRCEGNELEVRTCNTQHCPLWSPWSEYGPCSATCGEGRKTKRRVCLRGVCEGSQTLDYRCNIQDCPTWSTWSLFSCCSSSCGRGVKIRTRTCLNEFGEPTEECEGDALDEDACNAGPCNEIADATTSAFVCGNTTAAANQLKKKSAVLRIFGGRVSRIQKWPWQVSLQQNTRRCNGFSGPCWSHICGGTLIAPQWVVSAAHCTQEALFSEISHDQPFNDLSVVMGTSDIHSAPWENRVYVRRIIVHPNYTHIGLRLENDIELIKLDQAMPHSVAMMPVCMPSSAPSPSDRTVCYVTGWGYTELSNRVTSVLREAMIPILDFQQCRALGYPFHILDERYHMCAGNPSTGSPDTCRGDSGGPLVCKNENNIWYLAGITSFGLRRCGTPNNVGVYTPIYNYETWIRSTIANYSHRGC